MKTNPFKFGTVVTGPFFTNRKEELEKVISILSGENHLVVISPRRFGKTSLIHRVMEKAGRPYIILDLQLITNEEDLGGQILKKLYRIYPLERIKLYLKKFRVIPIISLNPLNNEIEISFQPGVQKKEMLEDVFNLVNSVGRRDKKLIIVMDEFQEIKKIGKNLDRQLRSIMQHHENVNYVFLGSQQTLMKEIFEKKRSPFYHFAYLLPLGKISNDEFRKYIIQGMNPWKGDRESISEEILKISGAHPYYTQQLAFFVWEILSRERGTEKPVAKAVEDIVAIHDMDFERLWGTINMTDKKILIGMGVSGIPPLSAEFSRRYFAGAPSTVYSGLKRLMEGGLVIRSEGGYEIDDPFFKRWIAIRRA
jgi:uncharacterized protein